MRKTFGLAAAIAGAALIVPDVALAETTPAPEGTASAVAAQVGEIIAVGQTSAKAGTSESEATANALALGGAPPSEQFGGSTKSSGESKKSGNLIDTGSALPVRVQVTPWEASTDAADNCRTASGTAALARVTVVDEQTAHVNVLQSESHARHCGLESIGSSSGDGATVGLGGEGGLLLKILHSEAASNGKGSTFLASINGNEIGSDEQVGGGCVIPADPILNLVCLTVGGGDGTAFADVAKAVVGDGALTGDVVGVTSSGSAAPAAQATPAPTVLTDVIDNAPAPRSLARTGVELGAIALVGAVLVAFGELTRRRFRQA